MKTQFAVKLFLLCLTLYITGVLSFAQAIVRDSKPPAPPAVNPQANRNQSVTANQPTMAPATQPAGQATPSGNTEQDHEQLRALLRSAKEAVNAKNFDALKPLFHEKFSITTVDQKVFTSFDDFKAHFASLFSGTNAPLKGITFNPEADALTEFVGDNIGLSHGSSTDTYAFADGDTRTMNSRWTATLIKDSGKWKILNLHIGANILENPVTEAAKSYVYKVGLGAGLGGLLLGFIIAWVLRGKR
jgi:hypothetical protein